MSEGLFQSENSAMLDEWWRDFFTIAGFALSAIGLVLTLIGLAWTIRQVYKIKSVATATQEATTSALNEIRDNYEKYGIGNVRGRNRDIQDSSKAKARPGTQFGMGRRIPEITLCVPGRIDGPAPPSIAAARLARRRDRSLPEAPGRSGPHPARAAFR